MEHDERNLIQAAQDGDDDAFAALVSSCQDRVIQVAFGYLHDRDEARDAAQEVFLKAYRALRRFNQTSTFWTWVYRITCNLCKDRLRHRARRPETSLEELTPNGYEPSIPGDQPDPRAMAAEEELQRLVRESLETLPEKHRRVLILREFAELSYQEIADAVGCQDRTVMSRLFHARRKLAVALEPYREILLTEERQQ